ncbi:MAG: hypothetical protein JSR60_12530 [Proteobacteria bacterium]|nr:hypothetical protein [Pseudomonadota bacterium]
MLAFPSQWAAGVVQLNAPDHLHFHFITDIGLAYLASGVGQLLGSRRGAGNAAWAVAGSVWPLLHGLFHVDEWIMHGVPPGMDLIKEGVGVILTGALGAALAYLRYRKGEG